MTGTADEALLAASPSRALGTELHRRRDGKGETLIVKNRRFGRYHRLSPASAWIWSLCDGRRTVAAIAKHVSANGGPSDAEKVMASVRRLAADGLVDGVNVAMSRPDAGRRRVAAVCRRLLTWRVTIKRVDRSLTWLYRHIGFVAFTRPMPELFLALMAAGFVAFVTMFLVQPDPFAALSTRWGWLLPPFFYGRMVLHEMAHAMATKHFRREVIGVGFGWFWIGPFFYVDTSDMWLAGRRERIIVSLAGAASDLTIAGACMILALLAVPSVSTAAFALAGVLYLIVLDNMSPLLEYDGYYALADLLDRPNLRGHSLNLLITTLRQRPIIWRALSRDRVAATYAVGSLIYTVFLLVVSARFNLILFSNLLGGMPGYWPVVLTWLATLGLGFIFVFGLLSDIRRLARPSAIASNRR